MSLLTRPLLRVRRSRHPRGQSLVEFALVLPIILVLIAGAIDVGRLFYGYVTIENAAKEGAFYGATDPTCDTSKVGCTDPKNVAWRLGQDLSGLTGTSSSVRCLSPSGTVKATSTCAEGDTYEVSVVYPFGLITPIASSIVGNSLTLRATESSIVLNSAPGALTTTTSTTSSSSTTSTTTTTTTTSTTTSCSAPAGVTIAASQTGNVNVPATITFTGTPTVSGAGSGYLWTFGDGGTSTEQNPSHLYTTKRQFDVTLTVTTGVGATCSTTVTENNYIHGM